MKEGHPRNYEDQSGRKQETKTPETARVTTRSMRKRSRLSEDMVETDIVSPQISKHHKAKVKQITSYPFSSELNVILTNIFFLLVSRILSWFLSHNAAKQPTLDQVVLLVVHFKLLANTC